VVNLYLFAIREWADADLRDQIDEALEAPNQWDEVRRAPKWWVDEEDAWASWQNAARA
jgi:hypothetical protein